MNELDQKTKIKLGRQAHELANQQRELWGLGFNPIPDIFTLLEQHKILVVKFPDTNDDLSGFSTNIWDVNCIYINSEDVLGRQSFTAAHELCHLYNDLKENQIKVCYHSEEELIEEEYRAQRFAAYFLMPSELITNLCNDLIGAGKNVKNVSQVIELQHILRVSFSAILNSLVNVKRISYTLYKDLKVLSSLDNVPKLQEITHRSGKSIDLIQKTGSYIPSNFIQTVIKNCENGIITREKLEYIFNLIDRPVITKSKPGGEL